MDTDRLRFRRFLRITLAKQGRFPERRYQREIVPRPPVAITCAREPLLAQLQLGDRREWVRRSQLGTHPEKSVDLFDAHKCDYASAISRPSKSALSRASPARFSGDRTHSAS